MIKKESNMHPVLQNISSQVNVGHSPALFAFHTCSSFPRQHTHSSSSSSKCISPLFVLPFSFSILQPTPYVHTSLHLTAPTPFSSIIGAHEWLPWQQHPPVKQWDIGRSHGDSGWSRIMLQALANPTPPTPPLSFTVCPTLARQQPPHSTSCFHQQSIRQYHLKVNASSPHFVLIYVHFLAALFLYSLFLLQRVAHIFESLLALVIRKR